MTTSATALFSRGTSEPFVLHRVSVGRLSGVCRDAHPPTGALG